MECGGASGECGVDLTQYGELGLSVNLNSSVSCLVNLQIQYVSHLLSDDAGRGARVEENIDGAGVGTACQDGTLMNIYLIYFHNGVTGDLSETGVGWG